jgi:hypothetical protein
MAAWKTLAIATWNTWSTTADESELPRGASDGLSDSEVEGIESGREAVVLQDGGCAREMDGGRADVSGPERDGDAGYRPCECVLERLRHPRERPPEKRPVASRRQYY